MKRIPLQVYHFANSLRIMVHFLLRCEEPHIFTPIRAIVDTGSPTTLIGPSDIKRMRLSKIQLNKLEGKKKSINIGGGQVYTKIIENANIKIGENFEIEIPIDFPVEGEENPLQPSLLGIDFMLKTRAKLFFDPNNREAYFEIED